ncbi:MAG: DUF1801 domain-containing protein [Proteobacteria bacterium]|nr:DUF1801 domain-containing protein [Pseudomonadota bacterium]
MKVIESKEAVFIINSYPNNAKEKLLFLRSLIIETATDLKGIEKIEETIKWGEPSYITKNGSTIRIDWKAKTPNQYSMFFNCKTKLVDTFKELYNDILTFKGNREITFEMEENIAVEELKHCVEIALTYKSRKNLPLLGV